MVVHVYNTSAGNITWYAETKLSGTYFQLTSAATPATAAGTQNIAVFYIAEAGDKLSVNTTTNTGLNVFGSVIEFDATAGFFSKTLSTFINGNNTIYTSTASKTACISSTNGLPFIGGVTIGTGSVGYYNSSGARSVYTLAVPSGQTAGTAYRTTIALSAGNNARSNIAAPVCLVNGDFLSINTDSNGAGQFAWVNVFEQ
jgi:hypothetical protein